MATIIKDVQLFYVNGYLDSVQLKHKDGKWRNYQLTKRVATPIMKRSTGDQKE